LKPLENPGGPDAIRTRDLCLRRATLYPAELRILCVVFITGKAGTGK
jgi:hypothetical protein